MPRALILSILLAGAATPLLAETHEIQMLNRGEGGVMVFEPEVLHIQPGDTVTFIAADRGHNAETIEGMIPEGAEPFEGRINEEISITFTVEGAYGYKCRPHFAMGMVGLIIVGDDPANLDTLTEGVRLSGPLTEKFEALIAEAAAG